MMGYQFGIFFIAFSCDHFGLWNIKTKIFGERSGWVLKISKILDWMKTKNKI